MYVNSQKVAIAVATPTHRANSATLLSSSISPLQTNNSSEGPHPLNPISEAFGRLCQSVNNRPVGLLPLLVQQLHELAVTDAVRAVVKVHPLVPSGPT